MSDRDRIAAAITDYLNGVAHIDTGDMADALLAAGVTMPAPKPPTCQRFTHINNWPCLGWEGHPGECW